MNHLKELFNEIKDVFKSEGVEVDTEPTAETTNETTNETAETTETSETLTEKFEDVVLEDGTVCQVEPEVTVGAAVVCEIEGELLPAPDGTHILSDGRQIVTESGVIVEVIEAEEEAAEEVVEENPEEELSKPLSEAQEREAKKIIESIVTERVFSMEATLSEENETLKNEIKAIKDAFNKLLDLTEQLMAEPKKDAVNKPKNAWMTKRPKRKLEDFIK
jgi:hypothetical protein